MVEQAWSCTYGPNLKNRVDRFHIQSMGWLHENRPPGRSAVGMRFLLCRRMVKAQRSCEVGEQSAAANNRSLLAIPAEMESGRFRLPESTRAPAAGILRFTS